MFYALFGQRVIFFKVLHKYGLLFLPQKKPPEGGNVVLCFKFGRLSLFEILVVFSRIFATCHAVLSKTV